jgi:hypothetical protein
VFRHHVVDSAGDIDGRVLFAQEHSGRVDELSVDGLRVSPLGTALELEMEDGDEMQATLN